MSSRAGDNKLAMFRQTAAVATRKLAAKEEELKVNKIAGTENPADLLTKNLTQGKIDFYMGLIKQEYRDGRAEKSLNL